MNEIMHLLVKSLVEKTYKNDKIRITIDHPVLTARIEFPFVFAEDWTSSMIMSEISKVVQSNKILTLDNNMTFHSLVFKYLRGGGPVKRLEDFLYRKQSIIRIKPHFENKLNALRAIIAGKVICDKDPNYNKIRDTRNTYQNDNAIAFTQNLHLDINHEIGILEISKIEQHLQNYQIIVSNNDQMNEIM
jgi:hypothetical protein